MHDGSLNGLGILVVEDEPLVRRQMVAHLEGQRADVTTAGTVAAARKLIAELSFDFALLDVNLPDGKGTSLLAERAFATATGVIVMTAQAEIAGAVEAIRLGALDYLVKPFDPAQLSLVIERTRRAKKTARLEEHRRNETEEFVFGEALAGLKSQLEKILAADERVETDLPPVLIHGETGTGKTMLARWIHNHGPRAAQPLVEVNCSALPETLAESELFGHERGAFTDARAARMGLFEAADGGTLFLDELPSLSLALQAKVLTAIEDHKIRRLGGNKTITVEVRVIAATNRELKQLVASGQFREDLYHRLDLYRLHIPPLRDRGEDILRLSEFFLERLRSRHRLPRRETTSVGQQRLRSYPWPGNVRELAHELERAIVFEDSERLDFPHLVASNAPLPMAGPSPDDWFNEQYRFPPEGFAMEAAINRIIQHALNQTSQNVSAAARLLGVTRDYLRYRLAGAKPPPPSEAGGE
ncbi:MAG: sigma-54-dependent Fis family transcriptional regulator [Verrucomicrobia bacterium]|nr:sigma-54-dependent Fis family transcriptional regulator [Verrucomicrobiota bacterium]